MKKIGNLTLYYGPMFAGKTKKLIENYNKHKNSKAFKPSFDTRNKNIQSRDGKEIECTSLKNSKQLLKTNLKGIENIYIDEVQFFDKKILKVIYKLRKKGFNVYVAGLESDYTFKKYEVIKKLASHATKKVRLSAICEKCGKKTFYTVRLLNGKVDKTTMGDMIETKDIIYKPMCKKHVKEN